MSTKGPTALKAQPDPVVSVMIMVYNHESYLATAISSVLAQDVDFPIEILLGEDCSTDQSREIALDFVCRYPGIVRMVTSDANVGAFQNGRRLLAAARGEFVAYLDGDDYWLPDKLTLQVAALRSRPDCSAVYANAIVIDRSGTEIGRFNDVGDADIVLAELLSSGNFLHSGSMLFRACHKESILSIEREFIDFRLHLEIARHGTLLHLARPLSSYRVHSRGSMVANDNDKVRKLYWEALSSVGRDEVRDDVLSRSIADFLRRVLLRAISARRPRMFLEWWQRASLAAPCSSLRLAMLLGSRFLQVAWMLLADRLKSLQDPEGRSGRVLYHR